MGAIKEADLLEKWLMVHSDDDKWSEGMGDQVVTGCMSACTFTTS